MIPVSSSKTAEDPVEGSGGPWGLRGASSECPVPTQKEALLAFCFRVAMAYNHPDREASHMGTLLAARHRGPSPREGRGACGGAALRRPSRLAAPGPPGGADPGRATVPLPRLAGDRDPRRGQRHDRPHCGRAEAAAADGRSPHHRALQVSGPWGPGQPCWWGGHRPHARFTAPSSIICLDGILALPLRTSHNANA